MNEISIGDTVRVINPDKFIKSFADKIRDRDAIVVSVFNHGKDQPNNKSRVNLQFQKRNGRGKVFNEYMMLSDIELKK